MGQGRAASGGRFIFRTGAGAKKLPKETDRRGAPCVRAYARAQAQSGARIAPPRNARGRAGARVTRGKGFAARAGRRRQERNKTGSRGASHAGDAKSGKQTYPALLPEPAASCPKRPSPMRCLYADHDKTRHPMTHRLGALSAGPDRTGQKQRTGGGPWHSISSSAPAPARKCSRETDGETPALRPRSRARNQAREPRRRVTRAGGRTRDTRGKGFAARTGGAMPETTTACALPVCGS